MRELQVIIKEDRILKKFKKIDYFPFMFTLIFHHNQLQDLHD